ncbi:uncharacterized protein RCC_10016 [Ramularia collo-cygni]|uniref:Dynactin subunit 6 n=1 Tax=Ramularia collo-cygni TaxID=112498 RepID=A0A2D3VEN7_9PEZI|nr:uncharacterized protein RCC_10016 [Ramularia collo-cygni]CZT24295.1 uncharacterized protein RCC_10016 [Ramularia collo-cygni]
MTSRPAPIKRQSAVPSAEPPPKPPCQIHASAVVAEKASISGSHAVELGENTVLHPFAKIKAENGKVSIGRSSVVCETAVVGGECDVHIGDGVVIGTGAIVEAKSIGNGTVIEAKAKIGRGAKVGKYCKITPLNEIKPNEIIPDYTVVYGDNKRKHNQTLASNPEVRNALRQGQELHVRSLKRIPDSSAKYA